MSLFTRARKHIDMNRVKELREEKIKEEKIAEAKEQQEEILAELKLIEIKESPKYSNWRRELNETPSMTTAGMGMVNLAPNLDQITIEDDINANAYPGFPSEGSLSNGTWIMNNAPDAGNSGITISLEADLSRSDTISTQVYFDNATIDPAHGMDMILNGPPGSGLQQVIPLSVPGSGTGSTNPLIAIDPKLRIKGVSLSYSVIGNGGGGREIGSNSIRITSTVPFRRSPMNVFVSLDDPEALSFVRGGLGGSEDRRQQLIDMLEAGNQYMIEYLGLEPSQTTPGDIELSQGLPYTDEDDAFDDPYYQGPPPDLDDDSDFNPDDFEYAGNQGPSTPVKYDKGMNQLVPNPGGGRPGKIRLKGKANLA